MVMFGCGVDMLTILRGAKTLNMISNVCHIFCCSLFHTTNINYDTIWMLDSERNNNYRALNSHMLQCDNGMLMNVNGND
jgi:hypothetical protein